MFGGKTKEWGIYRIGASFSRFSLGVMNEKQNKTALRGYNFIGHEINTRVARPIKQPSRRIP